MKITALQIRNYLGARAVDLHLTHPVTLIAGPNGAGKSSLRDAVALALTADLTRVTLKKDVAQLITHGADSAHIELTVDGEHYAVIINRNGKISDGSAGKETPAALPYVLNAQRFARLTDSERRAFLFGLMGLRCDGDAIQAALVARDCRLTAIAQITPYLRGGFEAAHKESAIKAREAKAAWKAVTGGETWGKDKAANWQPPPLAESADKAAKLADNAAAEMSKLDADIRAASEALGKAKSHNKQIADSAWQRQQLAEKAGKVHRITTKLAADEAELKTWEAKVAAAKAALAGHQSASATRVPTLLRDLAVVTSEFLAIAEPAPELWGEGLLNRAQMHLSVYRHQYGDPVASEEQAADRSEAEAQLAQYEKALALLSNAVSNGRRDLASAQHAAEALAALDQANTQPIDLVDLEAKVSALTERRAQWQFDANKYRKIADDAKRRDTVISQSASHHADVIAWSAIADALAPNGIPSELLVKALGPINARLQQSAETAEWGTVVIHDDMTITLRGRPYSLLSESEQWRADAMIAEAVSHLSGLKLLVLDRFDVLDLQGRADALYWLDALAGEVGSALLFGTFKAMPSGLPATIEAHWIENGVLGQLKEAA